MVGRKMHKRIRIFVEILKCIHLINASFYGEAETTIRNTKGLQVVSNGICKVAPAIVVHRCRLPTTRDD